MADSSTGGFLQPFEPFETADDFEDMLHDFFVGVVGLPGNMVRPKWEENPAGLPPPKADWCAFGILDEGGDTIGGERHCGEDGGHNIASVHEPFTVLVSFYGRNSRANAKKLRLGLAVAQNREYLYKREIAFVEAGASIHVPEIVGERWNNRWDIQLTFRRRVSAKYPVLNVSKVVTALQIESGLEVKNHL